MKKKLKTQINSCLIFALSASMTFTSVAAPLLPAENLSVREAVSNTHIESLFSSSGRFRQASASNADRKEAEEQVSYPEFGTDEFWKWYENAENEDLKKWYESIKDEDRATKSDASFHYPDYESELDSEFWVWFFENCYTENEFGYKLHYDVILTYLAQADYRSVKKFLADLSGFLGTEKYSAIGNLWPSAYGAGSNFLSDGRGTKESPYIIDSVEDLRGLASYVASGQDSSGKYYLVRNGTYDLNGVWIPIGFALNAGGAYSAFKGHLSAEEGTVVKNFGFGYGKADVTSEQAAKIRAQSHVGFFGEIGAGATIEGLTVETEGNTVEGTENVGILAGHAVSATIKNCTVSGSAKGTKYVGGIVGRIDSSASASTGRDSVIEDCNAQDVAAYITDTTSVRGGVGGVAGYAKNTSIVDVYVKTNTGAGNHIYGNLAYCGGVAGILKNSDIYNAHMESGEIGSGNSYANGGIVGGYAGGQIKVVRFSGTVIIPSSSNNYSACFIGTRVNNAGFTYGENGNIAYLFADSKTKADTGICGSKIQDDNNYGKDAHIGYWHSSDKKYTLVTGSNTADSDDYFYQELERGILNIKQKGNACDHFVINHFTADDQGNPVRGYLLTVNNPKVNGTTAAKITAQIKESYKPVVTSDTQGAFEAGDRIYVSFANQSSGNVQFKLDPDVAQNPYYTYKEPLAFGESVSNKEGLDENAGYWLTMPESDTIIGAEYKAVAQAVTLNPSKVTFHILQKRTGNRDTPVIKWYATAKDDLGAVITDAKGNRWENRELKVTGDNPYFYVGSLVNGSENTLFNLLWSTGNSNLTKIINPAISVNGNMADKEAKFNINIIDSAMVQKAEELREKQKLEGNKNPITTVSPYTYHALITGTAQANDSTIDKDPPKGYLDIDINFDIIDETKTSIDSVALSKNTITYNIVRTLSGDRKNPTASYTVNGTAPGSGETLSQLEATFQPDYFTKNKVKWYLTEPGKGKGEGVAEDENQTDDGTINIKLDTVNGLNDYHYGLVTLKGISTTDCTNTFVAGHVSDQNSRYTSQMKQVPAASYTYNKDIKVTAYDSNNNSVTDTCNITINFKTLDQTVIHPEKVTINETADITYNLSYTMEGDINSEIKDRKGFSMDHSLSALVTPVYDNSIADYKPYDKSVVWESSDPDVVAVDPVTGVLTPMGYDKDHPSAWIHDVMADKANGYVGMKEVTISAKTNDQTNACVASKKVTVRFHVESISVNIENLVFDTALVQNSMTDIPNQTWVGADSQKITATATGNQTNITYAVDPEGSQYIHVDEDGVVTLKKDAAWIKEVIDGRKGGNCGSRIARITVKTPDGEPVKVVNVDIKFRYDATELNKNKVTLDVLAVQGNNTTDHIAARTWSYGTDTLLSTVYSIDGVTSDTADYAISDNTLLAIDEHGNITPKQAAWMHEIIADGGHTGSKTVTVTAVSPDGKTKDTCTVVINFRYNNTVLNKTTETYDIVLTNNSRTNAKKSTWSGLDQKKLSATVYDENAETQSAVWKSSDPSALTVDTTGRITPVQDAPWMQELIQEGAHSGSKTVEVTASSPDGTTADTCTVTIHFRYDVVELSPNEEAYHLVLTKTSRTNHPTEKWSGNITKKLNASVYAAPGADNTPIWEAEEPELVHVDQSGNLIPVVEAQWMKDLVADGKHEGVRKTAVNARSKDGNTKDSCNITLDFQYEDVELSENTKTLNVELIATGSRSNPLYQWTGHISALQAAIHSVNPDENKVVYTSLNPDILKVDESGKLTFVQNSEWANRIKSSVPFSGTTKVVIEASSEDGRMADQCNVTINFKYTNHTYSTGGSGSSGSSGGGGGGGSSSKGVTPGGTKTSAGTQQLPDYVVTGTWIQSAAGKWLFTGQGRTYNNEWAAIQNPYADTKLGQQVYDWFRFDPEGFLLTGWFTDTDGSVYYLNPVSDNTLGRMFTGWNWIAGPDGTMSCYYFNPVSNGTRGQLMKNCTIDGYSLNENGEWTTDGVVQKK